MPCQCRKGARCLACVERDGLTKPKEASRVEAEGWIDLMQSEGGHDCLCYPPGGHVFCYSFGFEGHGKRPGISGPMDPDADDLVQEALRQALLALGDAKAVNGKRLRLTVEVLDA